MTNNKKIFEIALTSLSQNGKLCKVLDIEWEKPSCANIKCDFDGKKIKITVPEGCEGECIYAVVKCKDLKCSDCPDSERIKICPCTTSADCEDCHECKNNLCVSKCPEGKLCKNDKCVDCDETKPCPCNQVCVSGDCQCPPNKPFKNDKGCCVSCLTDANCPACTECTPDGCKPIECPEGVCDPETKGCVECLNTGDCSGENECCVGKKCDCCIGFVRNLVTGKCEPKDECSIDKDCGPCEICVDGKCVPLVCPEGYVCVEGVCKPICDCAEPTCDRQGACIRLNENVCYCNKCEGSCSDSTQCGEGCYCKDNKCVPNPCANTPCNNGQDCAEGCGCKDNTCVPCDSLDCTTDECAKTLGCKCDKGNTCVDDPDPCSNYSCDETEGPAACQGGSESRPDCGCNAAGDCVQQPCEGDFTLEKGDCKLTATLTSNKCCACSDITLISQIKQLNQTYSEFEVTVKKGTASNLADALELPTVDNVTDPRINGNEEPIRGTVCIDAEYVFEKDGVRFTDYQPGVKTIVLDGKGVASINNTEPNKIKSPDKVYAQGFLKSTRLVFRICEDLEFPNGCVYKSGQVLYDGTFTAALSATSVTRGVKTLDSDSCADAVIRWTKGVPTGNGVTWEEQPFRKVYVPRTGNQYIDFINKPDNNPAFDLGGSNVDNRGDLWSGYYYRVSTDCGCVNSASLQSCGTVGQLVFCNPDNVPKIEFTSCNGIKFKETWKTDCVVNYDKYNDIPVDARLKYGIYVNGSTTPIGSSLKTASSTGDIYDLGQTFEWDETIRFIDIKWSHDKCDECTIRVVNPNPVVKDLVYEINCKPLADGTTEYTVKVDFGISQNSNIEKVTLSVNTNAITPTNNSVSFKANPSTTIIASVKYVDCDVIYKETLDLPDDCCKGIDFIFKSFVPDCDETAVTVVVESVPTGLAGKYTFVVKGEDGNEITVVDPKVTNETGLKEIGLIVDQETFGSSPEVFVTFEPANGCDKVERSTVLNFSSVDVATRVQPTVDALTLCNVTTTEVRYDIPQGYSGTVTYSVCGSQETVTVQDGEDLVIDVTGTLGQNCTVTIVSHTLTLTSGGRCPAIFADPTTTLSFVDNPVSTFNVSPTTVCKDGVVTVNYTSNVSGVLTYEYNGTKTVNVTSGNGSFTLNTSTAGVFIFRPVSIAYGTCTTSLANTYSATITVNALDTLTITELNITGDGATCTVSLSIIANASVTVSPPSNSVIGNTYLWNNIPTGTTITATTGGTCPKVSTYLTNCNCPQVANPTGVTDVSYCSTTGSAVITATPPVGHTILWDNGSTLQSRTVTAGTYVAYAVNAQGCESEGLVFTVFESADPIITNFEVFQGSSENVCVDGAIQWTTDVNIPVGIASTTVTINGTTLGTSLVGSIPNNLPVGVYTATITIVDNNGCQVTASDNFEVIVCCTLDATVTPTTACSDVQITVTVGAQPITYSVSNTYVTVLNATVPNNGIIVISTDTIPAGVTTTFTVTITDDNGCSTVETVNFTKCDCICNSSNNCVQTLNFSSDTGGVFPELGYMVAGEQLAWVGSPTIPHNYIIEVNGIPFLDTSVLHFRSQLCPNPTACVNIALPSVKGQTGVAGTIGTFDVSNNGSGTCGVQNQNLTNSTFNGMSGIVGGVVTIPTSGTVRAYAVNCAGQESIIGSFMIVKCI